MSSSLSHEVKQHFVVIEEQIRTTEIRTVVHISGQQTEQLENQPQTLQTIPVIQEGTLTRVDNAVQEGTMARVESAAPKKSCG